MKLVRQIADVRASVRAARRSACAGGTEITVGLVPTMGDLHDGHIALIRQARAECDLVVVSLFVNPTQFAAGEDLDRYPRDEARDAALAEQAGADVLFAPAVATIYRPGFATTVSVRGVSEPLEGTARGAAHFEGVATVVTKLLNIVGPDVAYFGQKDAQQVAVLRRLVLDLDIPVRLSVLPTVRQPDGLALSSRNGYLSATERRRASALHRGLLAARRAAADGERDASRLLAAARAVIEAAGIEPEYLALVSSDSFEPVERLNGSPTLAAVAARVGGARLIDNLLITPESPTERSETT